MGNGRKTLEFVVQQVGDFLWCWVHGWAGSAKRGTGGQMQGTAAGDVVGGTAWTVADWAGCRDVKGPVLLRVVEMLATRTACDATEYEAARDDAATATATATADAVGTPAPSGHSRARTKRVIRLTLPPPLRRSLLSKSRCLTASIRTRTEPTTRM